MSVRRLFRIEYIFLFAATAVFCSALVFKTLALKNFAALDDRLVGLIEAGGNPPAAHGGSRFEYPSPYDSGLAALKSDLAPYAYFDPALYERFDAEEEGGVSVSALAALQSAVHLRQRKLLFGYDSLMYFSLILIALVTVCIFYAQREMRHESERMQAISDEKATFSRNLHDGVAQDLAASRIWAKKGDGKKADFYAERALREVRYLIDSLHLNLEKDFEALLSETLAAFEANWEIETSLTFTSSLAERLDAQARLELLRIVQEALSNAARHANARRIEVKATDAGSGFRLVISDDGAGFSEKTLSLLSGLSGSSSANEPILDEAGKKHWGLCTMRERVSLLGGEIAFLNGTDGGATIAVTIKDIVS